MILEGSVSVKAAILAGRREITKLVVDKKKKDHDTSFLLHRAQERNIPITFASRETIDEMSEGRTHGGILCEASARVYQTKEDTLKGNPFVVLVEGVEDPFNLGYIARSLYSAGCTGLILRERKWDEAEKVILRSSAGAFDFMNVVMSVDLPEIIRFYKENGFTTYAAMRKDAISYLDADYTQKTFLAIGGEMRGLSSSTLKEVDQNIFIPYANDFRNALNASGAASVLGFEVFRQRRKEGE